MKINLDLNEKYEETLVEVKAKEINEEVIEVMKRLKSNNGIKIIGKKEDKVYLLNPKDIIFFYTNNGVVYCDIENNTYEIRKKLYELEEELSSEPFVRISKFAIANIEKIRNIEMFFNGSLVINFINGKKEAISRRYLKRVKDYIGL